MATRGLDQLNFPDLPALFNQPQPANPHDYNDHPSSHSMVNPNPPLYHQALSTSNLPAATAISPHLGGICLWASYLFQSEFAILQCIVFQYHTYQIYKSCLTVSLCMLIWF